MTDTERRAGYVELGEKLDNIDKRLQKVELSVQSNLDGERSVWAAIEKLTKSIDESNQRQSSALQKAIDDANKAIEESVKDRAELHTAVMQQQSDMKVFANAYGSITGWLKSISVILITSMLGIVVGLLTHAIQIP